MARFYCNGKKGYCELGSDASVECEGCEYFNDEGGYEVKEDEIEKEKQKMKDDAFVKGVEQLSVKSPDKILNWYRNLYYKEPLDSEQRIVADAINEILPEYCRQKEEHIELLKAQQKIKILLGLAKERSAIEKKKRKALWNKAIRIVAEKIDFQIRYVDQHIENVKDVAYSEGLRTAAEIAWDMVEDE